MIEPQINPGTELSDKISERLHAPGGRPGRFAPHPVWFVMCIVVRSSQLLFVSFCIWGMIALFDAFEKPFTIAFPPLWPWAFAAFFGTNRRGGPRSKLSAIGDMIANLFALHWCPACGHDIFDPTPPHGYRTPTDRQAWLPSKICANCGHDLTRAAAA